MSKHYTQSTIALKTVTLDTSKLDAKKILIYPGEGPKETRMDIIDFIDGVKEETENKLSSISQIVSDHIVSTDNQIEEVEQKFFIVEDDLNSLRNKNYAFTDTSNIFSSSNTFNSSVDIKGKFTTGANSIVNIADNFAVYPLGVKTVAGADAYGLSISSSGGVQLWGTHFMQGDEWSDTALKIVHNNLALFGNHQSPTSLSFDNANVVEFKVMPDDGSTANNGQGAIFDFQAWQWDNDGHTTMNANCPVQILKNNSGSLTDRSVLNRSESDSRYSQLHSENTLTETNTFKKTIIAEEGVHATGGDVVISNGALTFEDFVDGTVVERSGVTGYQYVQGMPVKFENGVCYDIGQITNTTNLSNVKFSGAGRLVQTCELWFTTPATPPTTHQWPTNIYWIDSATGAAPTLIGSKNYRLVFRQEPNKIIASIAYLY